MIYILKVEREQINVRRRSLVEERSNEIKITYNGEGRST